jgi:hypothetical protein
MFVRVHLSLHPVACYVTSEYAFTQIDRGNEAVVLALFSYSVFTSGLPNHEYQRDGK